MIQAKCIEKIRDKNNYIIGYKLIDKDKNEVIVKSERLKDVIRSGQLEVINLKLTYDSRLIDKKPDTPSKSNINVKAIINKAKAIGCIITTVNTDCGHKCYIASSQDNSNHILIIPDDVKYVDNVEKAYLASDDCFFFNTKRVYNTKLSKHLSHIEGTLKIVGGKGLTSTVGMFYNCGAQYIDLKSFDTSNVQWMLNMFKRCKAHSIDLSSFNTSNVYDMTMMFEECEAHSLDLSSFNTRKVRGMSYMFRNCKVQSIDLSSFNTSKVETMYAMFDGCKAQSIDLSSFNTSKVWDMKEMFSDCKAQIKVNNPELESQLQLDRG